MFVAGEIDCRIHVYRVHKRKGIPLEQVVASTVSAYLDFINELQVLYPRLRFVIFNVLPQGEQGNLFEYDEYADRETRMSITREMNRQLQEACAQSGLWFVNVFDQLVTDGDRRIGEYTFDEVHYSNRIVPLVIEEMKQGRII